MSNIHHYETPKDTNKNIFIFDTDQIMQTNELDVSST